jgi:hypothetical protein
MGYFDLYNKHHKIIACIVVDDYSLFCSQQFSYYGEKKAVAGTQAHRCVSDFLLMYMRVWTHADAIRRALVVAILYS